MPTMPLRGHAMKTFLSVVGIVLAFLFGVFIGLIGRRIDNYYQQRKLDREYDPEPWDGNFLPDTQDTDPYLDLDNDQS